MTIFNTVGRPIQGKSLDEAMHTADLNWSVSKRPIYVTDNEGSLPCHTSNKFFATARDDNNAILGVVGPAYQPVQNRELAYLCSRLNNSGVTIETAGCLDGGRRVWIQMAGDAFDVGPKHDTNIPMTLFTNGHDGQWPLSSLPTTRRVICENTLNMALSTGRKNNMIISMKHMGDMQGRLEVMYEAIQSFKYRTAVFQEKADALAGKEVTAELVQNFWTNMYIKMFGDIHATENTDQQKEDNKKAGSTLMKWANTFDYEIKASGANLWTAMNSITYWLDHQQIYRGEKKHESRFVDTLFGDGAKEKVDVMESALQFI